MSIEENTEVTHSVIHFPNVSLKPKCCNTVLRKDQFVGYISCDSVKIDNNNKKSVTVDKQ